MGALEVRLSWDAVVVTGLRSVGPLQSGVAVVTFYDGALDRVVKVPGRPDTGPVTLERDVTDDLTFDLWARGPHLRKEVELALVAPDGSPTIGYRMHRCWVSGYEVAPDVENATAVERITLSMDAWERVVPAVPDLAERTAEQLGRSVVRVGLGRLVGATVQETEARLDVMLRDAQASGAVLLLDEADALFSRRTDVADAHDRYAATPLDAVLSRLSEYPGPVLVVPPSDGDPPPPETAATS